MPRPWELYSCWSVFWSDNGYVEGSSVDQGSTHILRGSRRVSHPPATRERFAGEIHHCVLWGSGATQSVPGQQGQGLDPSAHVWPSGLPGRPRLECFNACQEDNQPSYFLPLPG